MKTDVFSPFVKRQILSASSLNQNYLIIYFEHVDLMFNFSNNFPVANV